MIEVVIRRLLPAKSVIRREKRHPKERLIPLNDFLRSAIDKEVSFNLSSGSNVRELGDDITIFGLFENNNRRLVISIPKENTSKLVISWILVEKERMCSLRLQTPAVTIIKRNYVLFVPHGPGTLA